MKSCAGNPLWQLPAFQHVFVVTGCEILLCSLDRVPGRNWIKGALESVLEAEPIQTVALKAQKAIDSFKKGSNQHKHDLLNDWILSMTIIWIEPRTFSDSSAREREREGEVIIKCLLPEDICLQMCLSVLICDVSTKSSVPLNLHGHQCPSCSLYDHIYMPLTCTTIQNLLHFCRETMSMIVSERSKHL